MDTVNVHNHFKNFGSGAKERDSAKTGVECGVRK